MDMMDPGFLGHMASDAVDYARALVETTPEALHGLYDGVDKDACIDAVVDATEMFADLI